MGVHTRNPSFREEAEGFEVQGHSRLHSGPEAGLGHVSPYLRTPSPPKEKKDGIPGSWGSSPDCCPCLYTVAVWPGPNASMILHQYDLLQGHPYKVFRSWMEMLAGSTSTLILSVLQAGPNIMVIENAGVAQGEELLWVPKPGRGPTGPERLLASLASGDEDMVRRTSQPGFALWNPCACLQRLRLQASLGTNCPGPARDTAPNPLSFLSRSSRTEHSTSQEQRRWS